MIIKIISKILYTIGNLYAAAVLGLFLGRNDPSSKKVNSLISMFLNDGYELSSIGDHYTTIKHKSTYYEIWTANKYYGYMSQCNVLKNPDRPYHGAKLYDNFMPSPILMLLFRNSINNKSKTLTLKPTNKDELLDKIITNSLPIIKK